MFALASTVAWGGAVAGPAAASDPAHEAEKAGAVVERATGTADIAGSTAAAGVAARASIDKDDSSVVVTAPQRSTGEITAVSGSHRVGLGMPSTSAVQGTKVGRGTVVYRDAATATDLAVQPTRDGGARALVTLKSTKAAQQFAFDLRLPEDTVLRPDEAGGYSVDRQVADGVYVTVGTIEAPWAKDADGRPVETSYELRGEKLVQTVAPDADTAFPVVADPKFTWGIVTGTAYFNRKETKAVAQNGALAAMASWALPPGLNAYVSMHSAAITVTANKANSAKRCLSIKFAAGLFQPRDYKGGHCK